MSAARSMKSKHEAEVPLSCYVPLQKLLVPETGFLPLALVAPEPCFTDFLPGGLVAQLFAWHRKAFCPPEGISISFMGQFIVSRDRLRRVEYSTYQNLLVGNPHSPHIPHPPLSRLQTPFHSQCSTPLPPPSLLS